jgi:hypothetical protein
MNLANLSPRPRTVKCIRCKRSIKLKGTGRFPLYCSGACAQAAFRAMHPKPKVPVQPKLPLEERVAARVYQMLIDSNVITPVDQPVPPKQEQEQL